MKATKLKATELISYHVRFSVKKALIDEWIGICLFATSRITSRWAAPEIILCLPKTPSVLKLQRLRAFMRSLWDHDELSFRRPFLAGRLQLSNPCRPAGRDPCASSPTHRSPKERAASSATPALRPILVDRALAMVARLALQSAHRSPRYGDRLASQSFRVVLDAEITPASGKTERGRRNSPPDSRHERSEPVVGSAAHSRGTAQVRNRSRTIDRG